MLANKKMSTHKIFEKLLWFIPYSKKYVHADLYFTCIKCRRQFHAPASRSASAFSFHLS